MNLSNVFSPDSNKSLTAKSYAAGVPQSMFSNDPALPGDPLPIANLHRDNSICMTFDGVVAPVFNTNEIDQLSKARRGHGKYCPAT